MRKSVVLIFWASVGSEHFSDGEKRHTSANHFDSLHTHLTNLSELETTMGKKNKLATTVVFEKEDLEWALDQIRERLPSKQRESSREDDELVEQVHDALSFALYGSLFMEMVQRYDRELYKAV